MGEEGCLGAQESLPRIEFREGFLEEVALYLGFVALAGVCEGVGGNWDIPDRGTACVKAQKGENIAHLGSC